MRIAIAQNNYKVGAVEDNTDRIIKSIQEAEKQGVDVVVFSELCVCGYPPYDLLEHDAFIAACSEAIHTIARHTHQVAAIIGAPEFNKNPKGKKLFNTLYLIHQGEVKHHSYKALLPDYDVFDECRFFEPADAFRTCIFKGKTLALTICEDLWNIGNEGLYKHNPMEVLASQRPDIIINIAASPFDYEQHKKRYDILKANVEKYRVPLVYVNQVGAQTDLIFDGTSLFFDAQGKVAEMCCSFDEDFKVFDAFEISKTCHHRVVPKIELIHDALVFGIKDYFAKTGLQKAVIGLSGGIDSALSYALTVKALGADNVKGILMPSPYSSVHSVEDAVSLVESVNGCYELIPIDAAYKVVKKSLKEVFKNTTFDITEENIQARLRAVYIMAYANKFGHMLINTSNKSEAAVGYGTLYGDMCGGLAVLADVYKKEVYQLAHFINREQEIIPKHSITKPPSAELRPDQKDSDSLPDYEQLDEILFWHIEKQLDASKIISKGFPKDVVVKVLKLVYSSEFKRYQSAPLLRVSPKAFGCGRKLPIVASYNNIIKL